MTLDTLPSKEIWYINSNVLYLNIQEIYRFSPAGLQNGA